MSWKQDIRKGLWKLGYDITRFVPSAHHVARLARLLQFFRVDLILDVGANVGQFAEMARKDMRFRGRIISFEPVPKAFAVLEKKTRSDPKWEAFPWALGEKNGEEEIFVSENTVSSSLLPILDSHLRAAPRSRYRSKEAITVKTLESVFREISIEERHILLKLDVQGYEDRVLRGAENVLPQIDNILVELSTRPLYGSQVLYLEICQYLHERGYTLCHIQAGFTSNDTGEMFQFDGLFHRYSQSRDNQWTAR